MENKGKWSASLAFTLFELMIVLAIISAMIVVVVPFGKRSNDGLKIKQHSSNIAQSLRYAIDLAEKNNRAVKFVFNEKSRCYYLQIADNENNFRELENFAGSERFLDKNIYLFDIEGFEQTGQDFFLVFDPRKPWPNAWICISSKDLTETIRINTRHVEIEENSI